MKIQVLDHGYVERIEAWGSGKTSWPRNPSDKIDFEAGIIEAARQSTQGAFRGWDQDRKLLKYLIDHGHATPFEFAGLVIEVQAPIFVFREWHRHRTQSYNEMSARYAPLPDLYYVPDHTTTWQRAARAAQDGTNKQAGGMAEPDPYDVEVWHGMVLDAYAKAEAVYQVGLKAGVPKEVARVVMPVGHYSRMRAAANLRNWLAFLTLRMDPKAQWEIRQFAEAVGEVVQQVFPETWKLLHVQDDVPPL